MDEPKLWNNMEKGAWRMMKKGTTKTIVDLISLVKS
jgi:hypothetical protein